MNDDADGIALDASEADELSAVAASYAQERLWFIHQLDPDGSGYNVPCAVRMVGALDIDRLQQAFALLIQRHESLRTVFGSDQGRPYQRVLDAVDFRLGRVDLSAHEAASREDRARALCEAEAAVPFDLAAGPLIRGRVIRLADDDHVLMLNLHHIVCDGWSIGVLAKELGEALHALQHGTEHAPSLLPIQYVDYAIRQREWLERDGVLERQLAYWRDQLAGIPALLDLATDYPRPTVRSVAGATLRFLIDAPLTAALRQLAARRNDTLFMVLLAAVKVLLYRYTAEEDICVGTAVANRRQAETEGLIGMFVNTLVLRTQLRGEASFAEVLAAVRQTCVAAYEHQDAPFEKVVEIVQPQRNRAVSPLFQVAVALRNADEEVAAPGLRAFALESGISNFDLRIEFHETSAGIGVALEYSTALFMPERIRRMAAHLQALCRAVVDAPQMPVAQLDYVAADECRELLRLGRAAPPAIVTGEPRLVHAWFEAQAAAQPQAIALECDGEDVCFADLNRRANRIAHALLALGVGVDDRVAICVDRGVAPIVSLLGVLKAGAAYVLLDPDEPADWSDSLRDSALRVLLTASALPQGAVVQQAEAQGIDVIALDGDGIASQATHDPAVAVTPQQLACVTYAATGAPGHDHAGRQGVMIGHGALANYLRWAVRTYADDAPCDAIVSSPLASAAAITCLWAPLLTGGRALLLPQGDEAGSLEMLLRSGRRFDLLKITPAQSRGLSQRLSAAGVRCDVGRIVVGGEATYSPVVWQSLAPQARCFSEYGVAETVAGCCVHELQPDDQRDVATLIGVPIDNTQLYVLDAQRRLQARGMPGELFVAGASLARGYLGNTELTTQHFVADPFAPHAHMYSSGDRVRWREDGRLEYLGRIAGRATVRASCAELGDIEAKLSDHAQIETSVVLVHGESNRRRLVAYYLARDSRPGHCVEIPADNLRAHLQETLPHHRIPAAFFSLEAIPRTPDGDIDREALRRLAQTIGDTARHHAPRTATERGLVDIWAEVLQLAPSAVGINDDFFELGGHSLLAVRLMARISDTFERLLPLAVLFNAPTIGALAELLADRTDAVAQIVVPIQPAGSLEPVFAVPGVGGNVLSWRPLSRALGAQQPFYALQSAGLDGRAPPHTSVEDTAAANIAALRTVQAHGPYRLIGHSYGGVVAFEMARQLMEHGDAIASLVLLDSLAPTADLRLPDADDLSGLLTTLAAANGVPLRPDTAALGTLSNAEAADLLDAHGIRIDQQQFAIFHEVYKANLRCYTQYRPGRLGRAIEVSLYRATQRSDDAGSPASDYGWSALLAQPPAVADIDADHFSLLHEPAARLLADRLRRSSAVQSAATTDASPTAATAAIAPIATLADTRGMT